MDFAFQARQLLQEYAIRYLAIPSGVCEDRRSTFKLTSKIAPCVLRTTFGANGSADRSPSKMAFTPNHAAALNDRSDITGILQAIEREHGIAAPRLGDAAFEHPEAALRLLRIGQCFAASFAVVE